jgi:predicted metal-dependent RNase
MGNVLGLVLYFICTSDLPTSDNIKTATFTDDTEVLATHEKPAIASGKLQVTNNKIDDWAKKWRIKLNQSKYTHITFTAHNLTCPTVQRAMSLHPSKRSKILGHAAS